MTYPTIRPEITLDFANSRQLDPRITFSRSSSATYLNPDTGLITLASDHEARFEKEGLLIEESRTNKYPDSRATALNFSRSTHVTSTTILAPDGSYAEKCAEDTQTGAHGLWNNIPGLANNTQTTFTIYAKAGEKNWVSIGFQDVGFGYNKYTAFDLSTGTIGTNKHTGTIIFRPASASITPAGNGWYRLSVSRGTNAANVFAFMTDSNPTGSSYDFSTFSYTGGSNGDGMYFFGPQVEEQSGSSDGFATSYIPTSGSTVTRAADSGQITNDNFSSWYNQTEGSFTYDVHVNTGYAGIAELRVGTNSGSRGRFMRQSDKYYMRLNGSGAQVNGQISYPNGFAKLAYRMQPGDHQQVTNGAIGNSYAGGNFGGPLPLYDRMWLGIGENLSVYLNGHIARLTYYSRRLTDSELETLTL